ncbi:C2H2-like zinc finger protein [Quillaja saponaria]|uniref:C2H2-like zinc finger protein n=1 Tax=Quillaja saponaria TaxID=32244 RepID=A0AAD7PIY0_QUISA|nr:C2H2-like zinc finger protein [Quillaja saponaria]
MNSNAINSNENDSDLGCDSSGKKFLLPDLNKIPSETITIEDKAVAIDDGTSNIQANDLENLNMSNHVTEDDGRLHSLPHARYGPYVCPKCNGDFPTSQKYASHVVVGHYKFENDAQKNQRKEARFTRLHNIRTIPLPEGLTVVSERPSANQRRNALREPTLPLMVEAQGQSAQIRKEQE